jgi:hypothetical protein
MSHIKLFESWLNDQELNEGAIQVYAPGNPWKPEGSMTWPGIADHLPGYLTPRAEIVSQRGIIIGADFDYDKYIADETYRSIPMETYTDKSLPLFTEKNPQYDEMEFDFLELVPREGKDKRESWVKMVDKDGIEFMIEPHMVLDILKGGSVREKVYPGEKFLIDKMRGRVIDFGVVNNNATEHFEVKPGQTIVAVKLQNGETKMFEIGQWRRENFMKLDENKKEESEEDNLKED